MDILAISTLMIAKTLETSVGKCSLLSICNEVLSCRGPMLQNLTNQPGHVAGRVVNGAGMVVANCRRMKAVWCHLYKV